VLNISNITLRASALPIKAELSGSRSCAAAGVYVDAYAPVCALARALINAGHDPGRALAVYRGSTLCFRTTLAAAAVLTVEDGPNGTPRFRQNRPPGWEVGPPIAPAEGTATGGHPGHFQRASARRRRDRQILSGMLDKISASDQGGDYRDS